MIRRQIVGGTSARSRRCYASGRAGRGRGAGFRGVHVRIVAVPVSTAAAADGVASRPSSADQPASADGTTVRSPPQRRQPECRHGHYIQPEPATGSTRRGAGGAVGRKPHGLLQPRAPGGEVPAHLPGGGAADSHRGSQAIGETCRSLPVGRGARPAAGRRRAAVRLLPDRSGQRGCRLLARPVGDADACGRRLRILRERRAPRPVLRIRGPDLLLYCAPRCLGSLGMTSTPTPPRWHPSSIRRD